MSLLKLALQKRNLNRPPVWFMRQAGRYHHHYQTLRTRASFLQVCQIPELACEATLGPLRDFEFDAAILFSDLLFPLQAMGMGLSYQPSPCLTGLLRSLEDVKSLKEGPELVQSLSFQGQALKLIRSQLPGHQALLGFIGGPWTLFCYAVEGSHQGHLLQAQRGLWDGRFESFCKKLHLLYIENLQLQAQSGADAIAILDTCAGVLPPHLYQHYVVPILKDFLKQFHHMSPVPLIYYSKGTGPEHWVSLQGLPFAGLGIDWNHDLPQVLTQWSHQWTIQGNINPHWFLLETEIFEKKIRSVFESVLALPQINRSAWICGLGHGVLPKTPEAHVRIFLRLQKEMFAC